MWLSEPDFSKSVKDAFGGDVGDLEVLCKGVLAKIDDSLRPQYQSGGNMQLSHRREHLFEILGARSIDMSVFKNWFDSNNSYASYKTWVPTLILPHDHEPDPLIEMKSKTVGMRLQGGLHSMAHLPVAHVPVHELHAAHHSDEHDEQNAFRYFTGHEPLPQSGAAGGASHKPPPEPESSEEREEKQYQKGNKVYVKRKGKWVERRKKD
ncbi:MAG: hypothetical protein Q9162_001317 [Coniocarpon cinnabarinum]